MTIDELLCTFDEDSKVQINVNTAERTLIFIPTPAYYKEHRQHASMKKVGALSVRSLTVEMEEADGQMIMLLVIDGDEPSKPLPDNSIDEPMLLIETRRGFGIYQRNDQEIQRGIESLGCSLSRYEVYLPNQSPDELDAAEWDSDDLQECRDFIDSYEV